MPEATPATASTPIEILGVESAPAGWLAEFLARHSSTRVVSRGRMHEPERLPGFLALEAGAPVAFTTYRVEGSQCEVVTLHSDREGLGAGTALIDRVKEVARAAACRRLWLVTTNDNTKALRFYQRRGFRIVALHAGAIDEYHRTLKPEIPETGNDMIPIRDEIELELDLG